MLLLKGLKISHRQARGPCPYGVLMVRLYKITAVCNSAKCRAGVGNANGRVFTTTRGKITKINDAGREDTIDNVICPVCNNLAEIKIIIRCDKQRW
jgi:hypothetical protein